MSHERTVTALAAICSLVLAACDSPGGEGAITDATDTVLRGADTTPLFDTAAPGDTFVAADTAPSDTKAGGPDGLVADSAVVDTGPEDTGTLVDTVEPADTVAPEDTFEPADTVLVDTTVAEDTTVTEDTLTPAEPCDDEGVVEPCVAACDDFRVPMRACVGGSWGSCTCRAVGRQHIALLGSATHAGFTGTPSGHLYACYSINGNLALAYQFDPTPPNNWDIQLLGAAGDSCDLAVRDSERVHMVYGQVDGSGKRDLVYRTVLQSTVSPAEAIHAANDDDGHEPRVALGDDGALHLLAGANKENGDHTLRGYAKQPDGGWFIEQFEKVPTATYTHDLAVCGGQPVALYGAIGTDSWSAWLGTGNVEEGWETELLDAGSEKVGAGPTVACADGELYGVYQDFSGTALIETHSGDPLDLDSYTTAEIPTGLAAGFHSDLAVHGGWLYLSLASTTGDVFLALRPRDLSSPWRVYPIAASSQLDSGVLAGDVRLHVSPDGRPNILYFGSFGDAEGIWLAYVP